MGIRTRWAGAVLALAALPVAAGIAGVGGGANARIVDVSYVKQLKDGKRHNLVVDVKGPSPTVFAVADGHEYNGHRAENIHHGAGVQTFLIRNREFIRGLLDDFEGDGVAKVKLAAGNSGGIQRKQCTLELNRDGSRATGDCRSASF